MGARRENQTWSDTFLAELRVEHHLTQQELAEMTGIPLTTYRRLERGQMTNPPIRYLINIVIALGLGTDHIFEICEDEWIEWTWFKDKGHKFKEPPPLVHFARPERLGPKPDASITKWKD